MECVFKYHIQKIGFDMKSFVDVYMPVDATILSVGNQRGEIVCWAKVQRAEGFPPDKDEVVAQRKFFIATTGQLLPDTSHLNFLGTVMSSGNHLVFHIFENISV